MYSGFGLYTPRVAHPLDLHPLGAPGTRPTSSLGPVVYELEVRGVLLIADRPEAFAGALASVLRARPAARGGGPYRSLAPLGEVTSGRCRLTSGRRARVASGP